MVVPVECLGRKIEINPQAHKFSESKASKEDKRESISKYKCTPESSVHEIVSIEVSTADNCVLG